MTVASIDIGTNTVLLLIVKVDHKKKKIHSILELQKIIRIGKGLEIGKPIRKEKIKLLLKTLAEYKDLAIKHHCKHTLLSATNALRICSNKSKIVNEINYRLGLHVNVISGIQEAKYTFLGCTFDYPEKEKFVVIDIGGGSTEIILGSKKNIHSVYNLEFGVVSLSEKYFENNPPNKSEILALRSNIESQLRQKTTDKYIFNKAIAVAGTPTTLACIKNNLSVYDESLIENEILEIKEIKNFVSELSVLSSNQIKKTYKSVVEGREDVLLAGTILLFEIMKHIKAERVIVSSRGVRYGAVYDFLLNNSLRQYS